MSERFLMRADGLGVINLRYIVEINLGPVEDGKCDVFAIVNHRVAQWSHALLKRQIPEASAQAYIEQFLGASR